MQTSLFLAKLLGPVLFLIGISILFKYEEFRVVLRESVESQALSFLFGSLLLLGGLALVLNHNVWVLDWRLLITLVGWVNVVRGASAILLRPKRIIFRLLDHRRLLLGMGVIDIFIGAALSYFAYLA
jgi:hypothetical protein